VYVGLGFADTELWYLHSFRAVAMFGLPLVLFVADDLLRALVWLAWKLAACLRWAVQRLTAERGVTPSNLTGHAIGDTVTGAE